MDRHTLKTQVAELRDEIERSEFLVPHDREVLEELVVEIEGILRRSKAPDAEKAEREHVSAIERLGDATGRFEVSHPKLTSVLASMINSLTNIGV